MIGLTFRVQSRPNFQLTMGASLRVDPTRSKWFCDRRTLGDLDTRTVPTRYSDDLVAEASALWKAEVAF